MTMTAILAILALSAISISSDQMPSPHHMDIVFYEHAYGQSPSSATNSTSIIADHIVINEVDTNPPGNDAKKISEWVEIHNPTKAEVDISGWEIASTSVLKKIMKIPEFTIKPGQFVTYTYERIWFSDADERVELRNADGVIIDATPQLKDMADDARSWQRAYDGYALNGNKSDWRFGTATPGSSNGHMQQMGQDAGRITITVGTDKKTYSFGETVTISGKVSERSYIEKPHFRSESITLHITGPSYSNSVTLYPDHSLDFKTAFDIMQVHNIGPGQYTVRASYAGAVAESAFGIGYEVIQTESASEGAISVATDQTTYIPGQSVTISGVTDEIAEFATFDITVTDPAGAVIASGNPTPINGEFKMSVFISNVNPSYGTHTITAQYSDKSATSTFEVVQESRDSDKIALESDKESYMPGDKVTINGRLNGVWIPSLDVKVLQTKQGALSDEKSGSHTGFKTDATVRVLGDGSFSYSFSIPNGPQRLGDYKASFSGDIGAAGIVIHVVNDTESFVAIDQPLTLYTDKSRYIQNEEIVFTGYIRDISTGTTTQYATMRVYITVADEDGNVISSHANREDIIRGFAGNDGVVNYEVVAIPEESGRYTAKMDVYSNIFDAGNYTATATYKGHKASASFAVHDQYSITESVITTDKRVYGLGETVTLTGMLPSIGANQVEITLTKPDGSTIRSAAIVDSQMFTWEWNAPSTERTHSIKEGELRGLRLSVFGTYMITISTGSESITKQFKLSEDPANDVLVERVLSVNTSQTLYKPGDILLISGNVMLDSKKIGETAIPHRAIITVESAVFPFTDIYETRVYPDSAGGFSAEFVLPVGVFKEGPYRVTAAYDNKRAVATFSMVNDYITGSNEPITMHVKTDKSTYHVGETVTITGGPNKIIFVDEYSVSVVKKTDMHIECDGLGCGAHKGDITKVKPDPTASFTHQFAIPDSTGATGTYEITAEARIGTVRATFEVTEKTPEKVTVDSKFIPEIIIDRYNRITETDLKITAYANTTLPHENGSMTSMASPVSIVGSMITARGQENTVNIQVSTEDGTCVIGQSAECSINGSTRSQGGIYDTVTLGNESSVKVIYTGPGERLEKFSIIAGDDQEFLPDMKLDVKILKEDKDQVSIFYYKVSYMTIK